MKSIAIENEKQSDEKWLAEKELLFLDSK